MKRSVVFLSILFTFLMVLPCPVVADEGEDGILQFEIDEYREQWKTIDNCVVGIYLIGDAEKAGLDKGALLDFAKLKFKNYFNNIRLANYDENESELATRAILLLEVFVAGVKYPISYKVEMEMKFNSEVIYKYEYLGFNTKRTLNEVVKGNITSLIEQSAIKLYKVRGEL